MYFTLCKPLPEDVGRVFALFFPQLMKRSARPPTGRNRPFGSFQRLSRLPREGVGLSVRPVFATGVVVGVVEPNVAIVGHFARLAVLQFAEAAPHRIWVVRHLRAHDEAFEPFVLGRVVRLGAVVQHVVVGGLVLRFFVLASNLRPPSPGTRPFGPSQTTEGW